LGNRNVHWLVPRADSHVGRAQLFALPSRPFDDMYWQRAPRLRLTEIVTRATVPRPATPQPRSLVVPRTVPLRAVLMWELGRLVSLQGAAGAPVAGAGTDWAGGTGGAGTSSVAIAGAAATDASASEMMRGR
jgi:hypothetical protein